MVHRCAKCGYTAVYPSRLRRHEIRDCYRRSFPPPSNADNYACVNKGCTYRSNRRANVKRHSQTCPLRETALSLEEFCHTCSEFVPNLEEHKRNNHRKAKASPFKLFKFAFQGKVKILRRDYGFDLSCEPGFKKVMLKEVKQELENIVMETPCSQVQCTLKGALLKPGDDLRPVQSRVEDNLISHSSTPFMTCSRGQDMKELAEKLVGTALKSLEHFLTVGSGFDCSHILACDLHIVCVGGIDVVGADSALIQSKNTSSLKCVACFNFSLLHNQRIPLFSRYAEVASTIGQKKVHPPITSKPSSRPLSCLQLHFLSAQEIKPESSEHLSQHLPQYAGKHFPESHSR